MTLFELEQNILQHKLIADRESFDVVASVGNKSFLEDITLSLISARVTFNDVVPQIHLKVHLGLSDGLQLLDHRISVNNR